MEIANDPMNRVKIVEGKGRRRQLMSLFYKYVTEDVTILNTLEYQRLLDDNKKLRSQLKMMNELRQAELDRQDIHRPV